MSHQQYQECIDACNECAVECSHCATACLHEDSVKELAKCIQLDQDCAEICQLAVKYMASGSKFADQICALCAEICDACGEECKMHDMQHCQDCAAACFRCAEECRKVAIAGVHI